MVLRVLVVSTSRGDLGHLTPLVLALHGDQRTVVELISLRGGDAVTIEAESLMGAGVKIVSSGTSSPKALADWPDYLVDIQVELGKLLRSHSYDVTVLLGDRIELLTVAGLLVAFGVPIIHLHGGETTLGARDNDVRHAITKLSSLHFVSNQEHAELLAKLGEESRRIEISGALAVDNCVSGSADFSHEKTVLGSRLLENSALVTFHPVTNLADGGRKETLDFFSQLEMSPMRLIFTPPNQDPGRELILDEISRLVTKRPDTVEMLDSLGSCAYYDLIRRVSVVVGNSSSGVIDAPIIGAPSVDFGSRQAGRARPSTVLHVPFGSGILAESMRIAGDRSRLGLDPNYDFFGHPGVSKRIVESLIAKANLLGTPKVHGVSH